jgi:hypothetical protein
MYWRWAFFAMGILCLFLAAGFGFEPQHSQAAGAAGGFAIAGGLCILAAAIASSKAPRD